MSDDVARPDLPAWLQPLAEAAPGVTARDLSRMAAPDTSAVRPSAVLIAFRETSDGPAVLLIQRAADMRRHPGQVAFPGGAMDPGDADEVAAALREADEEVGLAPASVAPIATLPPVLIARSGFAVTPVLAWWHTWQQVRPMDPAEVARVAVVPVAELVDPGHRFQVARPAGLLGPGFAAHGLFVWGFTAMLLDALLRLGGWERPWDHSRLRDLPPPVAGRIGATADRPLP